MIYDEYPDMLGIRLMCNRICERVEAMDRREDIEDELEMQQKRRDNRGNVKDIVEVLLLNELMKRRNETQEKEKKILLIWTISIWCDRIKKKDSNRGEVMEITVEFLFSFILKKILQIRILCYNKNILCLNLEKN